MEQDDGEKVFLYIYDLTLGIARPLSKTFLGSTIDAVWHTGIGLYGKEYFFGPCIHCVPAGRSPFGTPREVLELGTTNVTKEEFEAFLQGIASRYSMLTYSLLNRNCNNFTDEAAKFLVGAGIPPHILSQADSAFDAFPLGATMLPMLQQLECSLRYGGVPSPNMAARSSPWPNPSAPVRSPFRGFMNKGSSSSSPVEPAPPRGFGFKRRNQKSG